MMMFFLATVDVVLEINYLFRFVLKSTGTPEIDVHFNFQFFCLYYKQVSELFFLRQFTFAQWKTFQL